MNTNDKAKRILCYGDSNTRWRVPSSMWIDRYPATKRRPGALQNILGNDYEIIEEWLWARTTMFDDPRPEFPERNWLKTLPIILESHLPLDLVILMLGTTDTKEMMNIWSETTAKWMHQLIQTIKNYRILKWYSSPKILIVVPPTVNEQWSIASSLFKWGTEKCIELIKAYQKLAEDEDILYLDPTKEVQVDRGDWVHIDSENHLKLAKLIYEVVIDIYK